MKNILLRHKTYVCTLMCILLVIARTNGMYRPLEVPRKLKIGNLKLIITKGARRQIQTRIYKLLRNSQNFSENLSRFKSYAPVMEEIFKEEKLPVDFKYLPILESSLIANARNSFGGVGFWQLQDSLAMKAGLEVNEKVDERMNIVASTRGAARFLRQNNLYFKNWAYTILSLHMGFESTKQFIEQNYNKREIIGVQELYIEERTHSFIKKFLAYKIAFEEKAVLYSGTPLQLMQYPVSGKTLAHIARKFKVSVQLLKDYNLWLKKKRIPRDKSYDVIIPLNQNRITDDIPPVNHTNTPSVSTPAETIVKKEQRLEPEFHNRAKNKPLAVTPPLPQPKIVIQSIENDRKKYPNIVDIVEKKPTNEATVNISPPTNNPQIVINQTRDNNDNPLPQPKEVTPAVISIKEIEVKPQAVERPQYNTEVKVEKYERINNPITNNTDYNTNPNKFFPEGISPRRNDQFINPNTPKAGIHVVAEGQTVFDIARRYNISVSNLRQWNYINNDVYVGQKLVVAPPKPIVNTAKTENSAALNPHKKTERNTNTQQKTANFNRSRFVTTKTRTYVHVVIRGQSLSSIAEAYSVSVEDIKGWNNLRSNVIRMGQKLVIFKVIRLLQHASPVTRGQFFREHKQTPLRNRLMHQQSKNLRKLMSAPFTPSDK